MGLGRSPFAPPTPSADASVYHPAWLQESFLFKASTWTASQLRHALAGLAQGSVLGRALDWLFTRNNEVPAPRRMLWLHGIIPALLLALLMGFFVTAPTQWIGLGLLTLTVWMLLTSALTGRLALARQWSLSDGWVLLFFASLALSTAFSSYPKEALQGLVKASLYIGAYFSFRAMLAQLPSMLLWLLGGYALLGLAQTALGVLQYQGATPALATWYDPDLNPELKVTRVFGSIQPYNPNLLAGFLIPCFSATLAIAFQSMGRSLVRYWPWLLISLGALAATALGIGLTGSRGGYIALFAMGLSSFLLLAIPLWSDPAWRCLPWLKWLWVVSGLSVLAGLGLLIGQSEAYQTRLLSIFSMREDSSIAFRLNVYASSWQLALDNLWVGIGPGNGVFKKLYGLYMVPGFNALGAYSVPLEILVEQGIPGLLSFVGLWLSSLGQTLVALLHQNASLLQRLTLLALLAGMLGFAGNALFDTIWYRPAVQVSFWLWLAALVQLSQQGQSPNVPFPSRS